MFHLLQRCCAWADSGSCATTSSSGERSSRRLPDLALGRAQPRALHEGCSTFTSISFAKHSTCLQTARCLTCGEGYLTGMHPGHMLKELVPLAMTLVRPPNSFHYSQLIYGSAHRKRLPSREEQDSFYQGPLLRRSTSQVETPPSCACLCSAMPSSRVEAQARPPQVR